MSVLESFLKVLFIVIVFTIEYQFVRSLTLNDIKKRNKYLFYIFGIQLFFLAGFRNECVYNDSIAYAEHFRSISPQFLFDISFQDRFEPGYQLIENAVYLYVGKSYISLFVVTSLFIQFCILYYFRHESKMMWFSIALFLLIRFYFFSVSGIRQGIAVAIVCIALLNIHNTKRYIMYIILASLCHYSALVALFFLKLKNITVQRKYVAFIFVVSIGVFFAFSTVINSLFSVISYGVDYYNQEGASKTGGILLLAEALFLYIMVLVCKSKYKNNLELWCLILLVAVRLLSIKMGVFNRFSFYLLMPAIVYIEKSFYYLSDVNKRLFFVFIVLGVFVFEIAMIISLKPEWYLLFPYKFSWQ